MALDLLRLVSVASLVSAFGCGPVVRPDKPPHEPGPVIINKPDPNQKKIRGRQLVIGEMCPQGAGGRPAVAPLVMRTSSWTDNEEEVSAAIERGAVPRFVVFGVDGKPAGSFDTLGLAEIAPNQSVASGTYVGASPCSSDGGKGTRIDDARCTAATGGCGLALGELGRPDDPPEKQTFATAGACLQGDALAVDIDGDKVLEQFPLAGVLDGIRSPSKEWSAAPVVGAKCTPIFEVFDIKIMPQLEAGKGDPQKHVVGIDVLGVADLDADGRMEIILAMKFPTVRTIAVYAPTGSAQRLELVGEGESFPR